MQAIKNSNRFWHEPRLDIIGQLYVRKATDKVKSSRGSVRDIVDLIQIDRDESGLIVQRPFIQFR